MNDKSECMAVLKGFVGLAMSIVLIIAAVPWIYVAGTLTSGWMMRYFNWVFHLFGLR